MSEYLAVLIFIIVGAGIVLITFFLNRLLRPHHPYPEKNLAGVGVAYKLAEALILLSSPLR